MNPPRLRKKRGSVSKTPSGSVTAIDSLFPPARKNLGQNFLVDKQIIDRFVKHVHVNENETVIEIGPGQGALTSPVLDLAKRLIAVEFDRNLIPLLQQKFSGRNNFTLVQNDALHVDFCGLIQPARQAKLIGNLPYNIATAILQRLIEQRRCLSEIFLILQKELVDRLTAAPNSKDRGFISVLIEAYYEPKKLFDIAPHSSRPAPKVCSSVVRLTPKSEFYRALRDEKMLWQVLSAAFAQRRKTLLNNLRSAPLPLRDIINEHGGVSVVLCEAGVEQQRRAEMLTISEWAQILDVLTVPNNLGARVGRTGVSD